MALQNSLSATVEGQNGMRAGAPWILVALLTSILGTAFFVNEVDWQISTYENYSLDADDAESLVADGSSSRKITYAAIGIMGATLLLAASRQSRIIVTPATLFLVAYVVICGASVAWSDDPTLSLKRVIVLAFCMLGVIGVAKHLTARNLLNLAIVVALFLIGMGLCTELALGTFRPFDGDYRFAGTVHPNTQGAYCAVLAIAGFFGVRGAHRGRFFYVLVFAIGIGFLILTKSRASCAGCMFALAAAWLLSVGSVARTFASLGGPLAVCLILIASLLSGMEVVGELDQAARLGRSGLDSGVEGLNGRVPLWTDLLSHVAERPLLGYGYNGFWTPARIYEISSEHEWTIATAHSVFIDVLLNVGLVGATFFTIAVLVALFHAGRRCLQTRHSGDAFIFSVALLAIVSSVFESGFAQPVGFDSFVAACGLMIAVMTHQPRVAETVSRREVTPLAHATRPIPQGVGGSR